MLLFCYGSLLRDTGPANVEKLRTEIPGLFKLAALVRNRSIRGILAPKPPNSDAYDEQYVFDFVGMLGLPLVPTVKIDTDVKVAFFSVHALKDPDFSAKLKKMLDDEKKVLITDGLADRLDGVNLDDENLIILKVNGNPRGLLELTREQLKPIRDRLLGPLGIKFDAPNKVALYLIGEDYLIVENFNDEPVDAVLRFSKPFGARKELILPMDGDVEISKSSGRLYLSKITPRTLVAIEY
jgi:hypothetical protein